MTTLDAPLIPQEPQQPTPQEPAQFDEQAYRAKVRLELERTAKDREQSFMSHYRLNMGSDPDFEAKAQRTAKELGITPELAAGNLDVAMEMLKRQAVQYESLRKQYPALTSELAKTQFVRIAHDDIENLKATEGTFAWMGRHARSGQLINERGRLGILQATGNATQADLDRLVEIEDEMSVSASETGLVPAVMETVGQMSQTVPSIIAAGGAAALPFAATGAPAAGAFTAGAAAATFGISGAIGMGNAYRDMIARGVPHDIALVASIGSGVFEGGLEALATKIAAAPFQAALRSGIAKGAARTLAKQSQSSAWGTMVRDYAKVWVGETGTELGQTVTGFAAQQYALGRAGLPQDNAAELGEQLWQTFEQVGQAMFVLALPGPAMRFVADSARARQAGVRTQTLQSVIEKASESKVKARDPDAHAEATTQMAAQNGLPALFVDGKQFAEVLKQADLIEIQEAAKALGVKPEDMARSMPPQGKATAELEKLMPEVASQIREAAANGTDVKIPTGKFVQIADTEVGKLLFQHVKNEGGMSIVEAAEFNKEQPKLMAEAQKAAEEKMVSDDEFAKSAKVVEGKLYEQLKAAAPIGMPARDVEALAKAMLGNYIIGRAVMAKMTPEQFYDAFPITIVKGSEIGAGTVRQDVPKGSVRLFRAAADDFVRVGTSFAENRSVADAYTNNPGFGGPNVYIGDVVTGKVLDLTKESDQWAGLSKATGEAIDQARSQFHFARALTENDELLTKLAGKGYSWVRFVDDFPEGAVTWVPVTDEAADAAADAISKPTDPNILRQDQRGGFDPKSLTVILHDKNANPSTVIHEFAHAFLEIDARMAASPNATPEMVAAFQTFLDWRGIKDIAAWDAMSLEQKRPHLEAFAYNFEVFASEGKAPTKALEGLFVRFRTWLLRVYKSIRDELNAIYRGEFGEDLPMLTPEVRAYMGSMLAAEEDIAQTEAERSMTGYLDKERDGMTDAEWARYQEAVQAAHDQAVTALTTSNLKSLPPWLRKVVTDEQRNQKRRAEVAREKIRAEVTKEVEQEPVYRARQAMAAGEDENKLNLAAVQSLVGEDAAARLADITAETGESPDLIASLHGFNDGGESMLKAMLAAPTLADAVRQRTETRMMAEHGELVSPEEKQQALEEAIHNKARAHMLALVYMHLAKTKQPVHLIERGAELAAKAALAGKKIGEISVHQFALAEKRANREVFRAGRKNDGQAVIEAMRQVIIASALVSEARKVVLEVGKAATVVKQFGKTDEKLAKSRDVDLVYLGRKLAADFGFTDEMSPQQAEIAARAVADARANFPALAEQFDLMESKVAAAQGDYRNLTLDDFRALSSLMSALWSASRRSKMLDAEGKKILLADADEAVAAQVVALPPRVAPGSQPPKNETATRWGTFVLKFWGSAASAKRVDHLAYFIDSGFDGPVHRYIVDPVRRALDRYNVHIDKLRGVVHGRLKALVKHYGDKWHARFEAPELFNVKDKDDPKGERPYIFRGIKELIGTIRHIGSFSNYEKLIVGMGWGTVVELPDGTKVLDDSRFLRFMDRMFREGKIDKEAIEYVQFVWQLYADLLPLNQATHKKVYGFEFETIELRKVQTPFGELAGGYVPAVADRNRAPARKETAAESLEGIEQDYRWSIGTGKNQTLKRNPNYNQPLEINVGREVNHLSNHLRFIHLQPAILDSLRVVKAPKFDAAMSAYDREARTRIWEPWLLNTARQISSQPSDNPILDTVSNWIRRTASLAFLGFSVSNSLVQLSGISNAFGTGSGKFLRASLWKWVKNPRQAMREAHAMSSKMQRRFDPQQRKMQDDIAYFAEEAMVPGYTVTKKAAVRWSSYGQMLMQSVADTVTWHAAYQQAVADEKVNDGLTPEQRQERAVAFADDAVIRTQGSGSAENKAAYEIGTPLQQLLTQFGTYSNMVLNQLMFARKGQRIAAATWVILVPALVEATIRQGLLGGVDDEDDDGLGDELAWIYARAVARNIAGMIPVLGPATMSAVESEGSRNVGSPAGAVVQAAYQGAFAIPDVLTGEATAAQARSFGMLMSLLSGLPLMPIGRAASYALNVEAGKAEPANAADYVRGLVVGR